MGSEPTSHRILGTMGSIHSVPEMRNAIASRDMSWFVRIAALLAMLVFFAGSLAAQPVREADSTRLGSLPLDSPQIESPNTRALQPDSFELIEDISNPPEVAEELLSLADVVASVYRYFPAIREARLEAGVADGQWLASMGAYDTRLSAYSLSQPQGFYRTYRSGLDVMRQTWWGGYLSAGYRVGRGQFEPWYKERETNRGGELSIGLGVPLLQGRAIDPQRVAVFQSGLAQQAVGPNVQLLLLDFCRDATMLYWEWVASGARLVAQDELLNLARRRQDQFQAGADAGKFAKIDVVFNRQLVAQRATRKLEAEQAYRAAGFRLSMYLRDPSGASLVPNDAWLPRHFPIIDNSVQLDFDSDFQSALARRPELSLLAIESQQLRLDRSLADNQRLPNLNLVAEASQDVGQRASPTNDKGTFELLVGLQSDVPIQRRGALGRIQQTNAKLSQVQQKIRLQQDKIAIELRTAYNALSLAAQRVDQTEEALVAAFETLQGYRYGFNQGFTDLIQLNLLETQTNEIEILMVDAQTSWFVALSQLQAALGLEPLDQAMIIASLPSSSRIGPGDMPEESDAESSEMEADWQLHLNSNKAPE